MSPILSPIILYAGLALGALGVALAMPRRGLNPQMIGALVAGIAVGAVLIALAVVGLRAGEGLPGAFFYVFALIGLGSALRVITHQRPVYAALYFVLTIIASAGLFLLLAAEFMTFALVIIYAGAILITYLFVIMLATEAPTEETLEALSEYDAVSREPIAATVVGFALLGALSGMLAFGVPGLPGPEGASPAQGLARLPGKVRAFVEGLGVADEVAPAAFLPDRLAGPLTSPERVEEYNTWRRSHSQIILTSAGGEGTVGLVQLVPLDPGSFKARYEASLTDPDDEAGLPSALMDRIAEIPGLPAYFEDSVTGLATLTVALPEALAPTNIETVGLALVGEHPLSLELAGVILLLAMVGAVVLARKQTEVEEERKALAAHRLGLGVEGGAS